MAQRRRLSIPKQKDKYAELNKRLFKYAHLVQGVYDTLNLEAANIATRLDHDGEKPFQWKDYPQTKQAVEDLKAKFIGGIRSIIMRGTSTEWQNSNLVQDLLADGALKYYGMKHGDERTKVYYQPNNDALKAFQKRKENGFNLSSNLWSQSENYTKELEYAISSAIEKGTSAVTLSKRLSKYLLDFPKLKDDYKERFGTAVDCHDCEYRSIRLARSEINMAYRKAENIRWQQMDFVVGFEIKLSGSHPHHDICDQLAGKYPKDFDWTGWHPNCYSDDSYVLTSNGWKLFADVEDSDLILSLHPDTRNVQYVPFVARQRYEKHGEMVRFSNSYLDCLVTPEHQMVYLNKGDGRIK